MVTHGKDDLHFFSKHLNLEALRSQLLRGRLENAQMLVDLPLRGTQVLAIDRATVQGGGTDWMKDRTSAGQESAFSGSTALGI